MGQVSVSSWHRKISTINLSQSTPIDSHNIVFAHQNHFAMAPATQTTQQPQAAEMMAEPAFQQPNAIVTEQPVSTSAGPSQQRCAESPT